jgi:hypothetical protein
MALIPLRQDTLSVYAERVSGFGPDATRRWGTMNPGQTLAHLRSTIETSLGEFEVEDASTWLSRPLLGLVLAIPWPKGKINGPTELFPPSDGELPEARARLLAAMGRFVEAAGRDPGRRSLNPLFGWQSLNTWTRFHGKHLDHHLRQFGV